MPRAKELWHHARRPSLGAEKLPALSWVDLGESTRLPEDLAQLCTLPGRLAPVYAQRVAQAAELSRETTRQAPVRTPGREMAPGSLHALKWADHKAEELLLSHGYASLRHDPVSGESARACSHYSS